MGCVPVKCVEEDHKIVYFNTSKVVIARSVSDVHAEVPAANRRSGTEAWQSNCFAPLAMTVRCNANYIICSE
jgi:hypothetical protein